MKDLRFIKFKKIVSSEKNLMANVILKFTKYQK